jgi:hypothetical protein
MTASIFSRSFSRSASPSDAQYDAFVEGYREREEDIQVSKSCLQRSYDTALSHAKPVSPRKPLPFFVPSSPQGLKSPRIHFSPVPNLDPFEAYDPNESPSHKFNRRSENIGLDIDIGSPEAKKARPGDSSVGEDEGNLNLSDLSDSQIDESPVKTELQTSDPEIPSGSPGKSKGRVRKDRPNKPRDESLLSSAPQDGIVEEGDSGLVQTAGAEGGHVPGTEEEEEEEEEDNQPPSAPPGQIDSLASLNTFDKIIAFLRTQYEQSEDWRRAISALARERSGRRHASGSHHPP